MTRQETIDHLRNEVPYFVLLTYSAYRAMCGSFHMSDEKLTDKLNQCLRRFEEDSNQNKFILDNGSDGPEILIEIYYGPSRGVGVAPGSWIGNLGLIYQSRKHSMIGGIGEHAATPITVSELERVREVDEALSKEQEDQHEEGDLDKFIEEEDEVREGDLTGLLEDRWGQSVER